MDFVSSTAIGSLIVFTIMAVIVLLILLESLRTHLGSVARQAEILNQQLELTKSETAIVEDAVRKIERIIAEREELVAQQETELEAKRQRLAAALRRRPTFVYVLDQIIQPSHKSWLVSVHLEGATGTDGDWTIGRRYLVFAETLENARRRVEVRFPLRDGFLAAEPQPFEII